MLQIDKSILFLPSWYPNKKHHSIGSFIRTHAEALNKQIKVDVLHICGDEDLKNKLYQFEYQQNNGIDTYILYYKKVKAKHLIAQFSKALLYVVGQFYGYYRYRKLKPQPKFFHVHVLTRAAILPFLISLISKRKYFITEHWSRYLPEDNTYQGFFRKLVTKLVVRHSNGISAVSEDLKFYMENHGLVHNNFKVIANIARKEFVECNISERTDYYIHVSNFAADTKNVLLILEAFKNLKDKGIAPKLIMIGDGDDYVKALSYSKSNQLDNVEFIGFVYGAQLVDLLKDAKAMILFSNYETQSVVTIESLCLGVPVISSANRALTEIINKNNGVLVPPRDVKKLSETLAQFEKQEFSFNPYQIKEQAIKRFSENEIAQQFLDFYKAGGVEI